MARIKGRSPNPFEWKPLPPGRPKETALPLLLNEKATYKFGSWILKEKNGSSSLLVMRKQGSPHGAGKESALSLSGVSPCFDHSRIPPRATDQPCGALRERNRSCPRGTSHDSIRAFRIGIPRSQDL